MGQPLTVHPVRSATEFIGGGSDTQGSETSQYLEEQKTKRVVFRANVMFVRMEDNSRYSLSSGERNGNSPNLSLR